MLQHFGFDFQRARAVQMRNWDTVSGIDLARIACQDLSAAADTFGAPFFALHRVDLHKELLRLANVSQVRGPHAEQESDGIVLRLASPVTRVDAGQGRIEFADGTVKHAHLIVGADGLRSVVRNAVIREPQRAELISTGQSAFRFLISTEELQATVSGRKLLDWKTPGACLLADTKSVDGERHMMWYPCREYDSMSMTRHALRSIDVDSENFSVALFKTLSAYIRLLTRRHRMRVRLKHLDTSSPIPTGVQERLSLTDCVCEPPQMCRRRC